MCKRRAVLLHQSAERAPNRKIITQRCFCAAAANRTRTHSPEEVNKNPDTRHFSSTRRAHHYAQRKYKLWGCVASGDGWPREHFTHSRTIFNPPMNLFLCKNILAPVQAEWKIRLAQQWLVGRTHTYISETASLWIIDGDHECARWARFMIDVRTHTLLCTFIFPEEETRGNKSNGARRAGMFVLSLTQAKLISGSAFIGHRPNGKSFGSAKKRTCVVF